MLDRTEKVLLTVCSVGGLVLTTRFVIHLFCHPFLPFFDGPFRWMCG